MPQPVSFPKGKVIMMQEQQERTAGGPNRDMVIGRNPVMELLKSGRPVDKLLVAQGEVRGSIGKIISLARQQGILVKDTNGQKMDALCGGASHQGVIAYTAAAAYAQLEDVFQLAESRGEPVLILIADELEDPHNLGAILRTAECCGAHGVLIPPQVRRNMCRWCGSPTWLRQSRNSNAAGSGFMRRICRVLPGASRIIPGPWGLLWALRARASAVC